MGRLLLLIASIGVFGCGAFGVGCLTMVSVLLYHRVPTAPDKPLLTDTLLVQVSAGLCLLLECSSLLWDTLTPTHFPACVRWPILLFVVPVVTRSAMRLLRHYLRNKNGDTQGMSTPVV